MTRVCFCALCLCACAESEPARIPDGIADSVEIAERDPGPACCPLESVEVRSRAHEGPSLDAIRLYAWRREANYVVVDTFSILDEGDDGSTELARARLYRCPPLLRVE